MSEEVATIPIPEPVPIKAEPIAVQVEVEHQPSQMAMLLEALKRDLSESVTKEIQSQVGEVAPSERLAREVELFAKEARATIVGQIDEMAKGANEALNASARRRAHLFKGMIKKVAKRSFRAELDASIKSLSFLGNPEDRATVLEAVKEYVASMAPSKAGELGALPSPSAVMPDPNWDPALCPGLTDFLDVWYKHGPRSAMITGPSGCGKTHPVRQWSIGKTPVWQIQGGEGCATRREAIGGYVLAQESGASVMQRQIGIAAAAAKIGGVLLIDEYDKIDPFVLGQLNDLIDMGGVTMPWGEFIKPHESFRVVLTGNGMADDSGAYVTHQTSSELPMRCWGTQVTWPTPKAESSWLVKAGAAKADADLIAGASAEVRKLTLRPSPSLRTSLFVSSALKAMTWKEAWLAAYFFQFRKDQAKEAANVVAGKKG